MEDKIKALRAELETLENEEKYLQAYRDLCDLSRAENRVSKLIGYPIEFKPLHKSLQHAKEFVATRLGSKQRADMLTDCGVPFSRAVIGYHVTDYDAAYALATWLFDTLGHADGCASRQRDTVLDLCVSHCPQGVKLWKEGHHDT